MSLRDSVFEALNNARYSGYTALFSRTASEIADDLLEYDADVEGSDHEAVRKCVLEWLAQ